MVNSEQIFDFWNLFVNELFGDIWLFIFGSLALIWIVGLRYSIPAKVLTLLSIMWMGIIFAAEGGAAMILWVIIVFGVGTIFYYFISKKERY